MTGSLLYPALERLGIPRLARSVRRAGLILCYHDVCAGGERSTGLHMQVNMFEAQMRWLASEYEVIPLRELARRVRQGRDLRRLAALTFDDGYAGVFEFALPVLRTLGLPATVFVIAAGPGRSSPFWWDRLIAPPTGTLRKHLLSDLRGDERAIAEAGYLRPRNHANDWCGIAEWSVIAAAARDGVDVGVHSSTHRSLPSLSDRDLHFEIQTSRDVIANRTGIRPEIFAYPYGHWDERVCSAVREAGYAAAVTLDPGLNRADADPWSLRRINVPSSISRPGFRAWAAALNPRWLLA